MNTYKEKVIFSLPGIFQFYGLYTVLMNQKIANPHYFRDNVIIGSFYDSPGGIWNGGRFNCNPLLKPQMEVVKDWAHNLGIPIRFTFTNLLVEEKHTYDTYCNLILEVFNTGNNEITVASDVLESYIREQYGNNYKYISSTTKRLNDEEAQKSELKKDYHLVVLDYDHNKNFSFLTGIEEKDKCELLCNAVCIPNCANRAQHYELLSMGQINYTPVAYTQCEEQFKGFRRSMEQSNFISVQDINDIYLPMGFHNFKIEGRNCSPCDMVEALLYYLVKEEYQMDMRYSMYPIFFNNK